jgi:hypothetical protein
MSAFIKIQNGRSPVKEQQSSTFTQLIPPPLLAGSKEKLMSERLFRGRIIMQKSSGGDKKLLPRQSVVTKNDAIMRPTSIERVVWGE